MIVFQPYFFSYSISFDTMPDFDSCSFLLAGCRKVAIPPFLKCRCHRYRFRKQPDHNFAAAAILGSFGSLFANLAGFIESAAAAGFSGVAGLAAASVPAGNSVRNCIDFLQSWLILPRYRSRSFIGFFSLSSCPCLRSRAFLAPHSPAADLWSSHSSTAATQVDVGV